jgi:hypothetical protein
MTIRMTTLVFFLVALVAGAWPLALPTVQSNAPMQVSHAAEAVSPAA